MPTPGSPKLSTLPPPIKEVAAGELLGLQERRLGDACAIEGVEGLPGRQLRGIAEAVQASLAARVRLELEYLRDERDGIHGLASRLRF